MDMQDRPRLMVALNLTPDSFYAPSRVSSPDGTFAMRVMALARAGADILDLGAVSTRPGAAEVTLETEWERLEPALRVLSRHGLHGMRLSIDTTRAEVVRRASMIVDSFIVNDISAGEDDAGMLGAVAALGLDYIAMHKRGGPHTMDAMTDYPEGIMDSLTEYFRSFSQKAEAAGIQNWILDPGLGFAKTPEQNWEILLRLRELKRFGRPVLIGAADKRFTHSVPPEAARLFPDAADGTEVAESLAASRGADILRVHRL